MPANPMPTEDTGRTAQEALNAAVIYALRMGCFFPVPEPKPDAPTEDWIRWGAMRNLHNAIADFYRTPGETERGR